MTHSLVLDDLHDAPRVLSGVGAVLELLREHHILALARARYLLELSQVETVCVYC